MTLTRAIPNRRKLKPFGRRYAVNLKSEVLTVKNYTRRLAKIEAASPAFADVLKLIRRGARYDELNDQQKSRYCSMIGTPRRVYEEIELAVVGDLHILLQKFDPPTLEELKSIVDELKHSILSNN